MFCLYICVCSNAHSLKWVLTVHYHGTTPVGPTKITFHVITPFICILLHCSDSLLFLFYCRITTSIVRMYFDGLNSNLKQLVLKIRPSPCDAIWASSHPQSLWWSLGCSTQTKVPVLKITPSHRDVYLRYSTARTVIILPSKELRGRLLEIKATISPTPQDNRTISASR